MTRDELIKKFSLSVKNGKINSSWKKKNLEAGLALLDKIPDAESITEAWHRLINGLSRPTCKICGGKVTFSHKRRQYSTFCSARCGQRDRGVISKRESTNLERHGERKAGAFGSSHHKRALISNYGADHPMKIQSIKDKLEQTNLARHGARNVFTAKVDVIKSTFEKKYGAGVTSSMHLDSVKAKFRNEAGEWIPAITNSSDRRARSFQTIKKKIERRLVENGFELLKADVGFSYKHQHEVRHHKCGAIFQTPLYSGAIPRCLTCDPILTGTSTLQKKVEEFLLSRGEEIQIRAKILNKREIDILIPSRGIGIEVNGLYFHSELAGKSSNYHLDKTELARAKGIKLIHLFEDDINQRWSAVESLLLTAIGQNKKIGGRKCSIRFITKEEANNLCDVAHLRGRAKHDRAIGLFYNDELITCATFAKPRYSKRYEWELIRFCTAKGITVVGGFSKVMSFFEDNLKPKNIISYADRCYSTGNVYEKGGFELSRVLPPNYWYFNGLNVRQHQTQLRKYKLSRFFDKIDISLTEWEILRTHGWNRIWDCGQLEYIKEFNANET